MVELKNTSKVVVVFWGLLANGQAIVFMPEQTLQFAESALRLKWQKFIAKYRSDVQVTKIDGVEPEKALEPKQDTTKPKTQKPAPAKPAENKEGTPASPAPASPTAPAASSASGQPTSPAAPVTNTPTQPPAAANPAPASPPKAEGGGKPAASSDSSAAANGGVSDEGLATILSELGD